MKLDDARSLAEQLMKEHNLHDWTFEFDYAKRRFGCCHHRDKRISLSRFLTELNDEHHVKNTILHEITHAVLPPKTHHSKLFYEKCVEIGCRPQRCYPKDVIKPKPKWTAICKYCGKVVNKCRKPRVKRSCGNCSGGRYKEKYRLIFKKNKNDV